MAEECKVHWALDSSFIPLSYFLEGVCFVSLHSSNCFRQGLISFLDLHFLDGHTF